MQPKVTRTERSSWGKNRNSSLIGHTSGVALIGEKKHSPALLELPTYMEYPVALELISSLRICDRLLPWKDIFNRAKRHTHTDSNRWG